MDNIRNWHREYPWLPSHVPDSQIEVVMRKAKGHSNGYIAQELGISESSVSNRLSRFKKANPEYGSQLQAIINTNLRIRENLHRSKGDGKHVPLECIDNDDIQEVY